MRVQEEHRVVLCRAIGIAVILAAIPWASLRADEPAPLPPAWACLPERTTLVLRFPNLAAFVDAFVQQTRLGAAMNDADRWKNALDYFARQCGTELEEVERKLAAYDLKIDDWRALAAAELGYAGICDEEFAAIAAGKTNDSNPELHEAFVAWLEPTDELGGRLWKAWDRWTSQAVADHAYLKRVDESLADTLVIRLSAKDPPIPHGTLNFGGGFSGRGLSFFASNDPEAKKKKDSDDPASPRGEYHLLVARVGRRFLLVHNTADEVKDEEQAQANSKGSLERCRQVMAQLLERHRQRGEPSPWLREAMAQTPRDGAALFELYGNLPLLFTALINWMDQDQRHPKEEWSALAAELWSVFKPTLAGVGTVVIRGSLQENRWERTIRVGLAQERGGLLGVVDAGSLPAEPLAWIPATAQSYSQINLDAAPIAEQLRGIVQAIRHDPDYGGALALVESQSHVDLAELISGLGPRMIFVEFADSPEGKQRVGPADAVLWQVRNEEMWQKALEAAASSFGQKLLKRDGYVGVQIPLSDDIAKQYKEWMPWLLAGHGNLLYVAGEDPTGPPLTHLPQPAVGGDSFRDSRAFRRFTELFPGAACFAFQCTDRSAPAETASWLNSWVSQFAKLRLIPYATPKDKSKEALRAWSRRLLGEEPSQALLSLEADQMTIEPDGVLHRWVLEFVAPER